MLLRVSSSTSYKSHSSYTRFTLSKCCPLMLATSNTILITIRQQKKTLWIYMRVTRHHSICKCISLKSDSPTMKFSLFKVLESTIMCIMTITANICRTYCKLMRKMWSKLIESWMKASMIRCCWRHLPIVSYHIQITLRKET
jgi:hypothetical protein